MSSKKINLAILSVFLIGFSLLFFSEVASFSFAVVGCVIAAVCQLYVGWKFGGVKAVLLPSMVVFKELKPAEILVFKFSLAMILGPFISLLTKIGFMAHAL